MLEYFGTFNVVFFFLFFFHMLELILWCSYVILIMKQFSLSISI